MQTLQGSSYSVLVDVLFLRYVPIGVESDQKTDRGTNRFSAGGLIGFQDHSSKYDIII
ncbi:MAG: hypothetical protein ABSA79_12510 [Candidatus Bathyarchaeia archaeon]